MGKKLPSNLETYALIWVKLIRGAYAYKREFYDHVRVNMMCLRKRVDQKRAAPPGYRLF